MSKKLTPIEFERMENFRLRGELREVENKLLMASFREVEQKKHIFELMIENLGVERYEIAAKRDELKVKKDADKRENEEFLDSVKKRLKLSGRFGYNPDTLEIVEDEGASK